MRNIDWNRARDILHDYSDTDLMDIGRKEPITNPDGYESETDDKIPKYTDVACNLSIRELDNPDPVTVSTKPVIQVFYISCPIGVDLQNNDFITVKRKTLSGDIQVVYAGIIGEPTITKLRQIAVLEKRRNV